MKAALAGIRVLDFTQMMAGPLCSMLLGDLGADVIKVEPPGGDSIRRTGETRLGGETEYFLALNRNKRSVVVDLKTETGREMVRALAAGCDVVVENFRPGTADRLGVGYEALRAVNPRLVYCAMSGFGTAGPDQERPALDPVVQAMSGIMQLTGTASTGPLKTGFPFADFVTPLMATIGILAALRAREQTGQGQRVDVSMLDATIFGMIPREGYYFATGRSPEALGNEHYQLAPYNTYETADHRHLMVVAHTEEFWQALLAALRDPALGTDPRFATNAERVRHREALNARLAELFRTAPLAEWERRLAAAGVLFAPVRTLAEVFADPRVRRDMLVELEHPTAGQITVLANPIRLSATPVSVRRPPPLLGQHTEEVLAEVRRTGTGGSG